jgi:hypothetical protein
LFREKLRQKYERRIKLDDIRRDLYSRYVSLAQRAQWLGENKTLAELAETESAIRIVATEPVRECAWKMFEILSQLFLLKDHGSAADRPEAEKLMHDLQRPILQFCDAGCG